MLRQYIDPLAWAFYLQRRPRLPGKRRSLVLLLILTLHFIRVSGGIICDCAHPDPIHLHHADALARRSASSLSIGSFLAFNEHTCRRDSCSPCSKTLHVHVRSSIACWG